MNILVSDKLAKEGMDILKAEKSFKVDCKFGMSPEELKSVIKNYDALIVRSGTKVTGEILEEAKKLKFIGRAGVGLDNVDLKVATKKGIVAMNTPAGNTTSTAEHTMSLILALSRNIPQAYASLKEGKWERSKFTGVELHGKTLGIIGLGRIGSTVAKMAKSFGMKIIAHDPYLSMEVAAIFGVEVVELEGLFKQSDYITIHIPKSVETKGLIGAKEFAFMKNNVRIINCARGGIVDESDLAKALESGRIAGCAVDVYEKEPPPADLSFLKFGNCVATPHLGAATCEAQINVAVEIAETIRDALLGKGIKNASNFPSMSEEAHKVLAPYMNLAQKMGRFAGQLINGRMTEIKITYSGDVTEQKVAPVTMQLVYGLLSPILGESVNAVNAIDYAKERGINIQEINSNKEEEFVNRVSIDVVTDKEIFTLWGTLSGNNQPRIVKINDVYVEAVPESFMIFIKNNDKPGVVGTVGTLLAEDNINIGAITFGRSTPGGVAVSVVNVDSDVSDETVKKLEASKDILFVKVVRV